jgi:ABC-2 type transport system ATP-binding protein
MNSPAAIPPISPALAVDHVSHSYGSRPALVDVSFAIVPATFTVLLGLNGAGKTTLFSLITRLYAARQGRILVFGHDVASAPGPALARIGVVFQDRTLDLDLTVSQNLAYHAALHGIVRSEAGARAEAVLARVGLADRGRDKVRSLSGGQMRRLEIARALLHRPPLIVLDEPTVGLDIASRADLIAHVRRLVAEDGVCVLWATHLTDEIADGDDVIVLHRGCVLAHAAVLAVMAQAGAADIRSAFAVLTGGDGRVEAA